MERSLLLKAYDTLVLASLFEHKMFSTDFYVEWAQVFGIICLQHSESIDEDLLVWLGGHAAQWKYNLRDLSVRVIVNLRVRQPTTLLQTHRMIVTLVQQQS